MNDQVSMLSIGRILIGLGAWLMPGLGGRLFGLDPERNPQASFLSRLFGIRDFALGLGTLTASGATRRALLRLGVICDTADAAAAVIAKREGTLPRWAAATSGVLALSAVGIGAASLVAGESAGE
jgi:hypothetical protein